MKQEQGPSMLDLQMSNLRPEELAPDSLNHLV